MNLKPKIPSTVKIKTYLITILLISVFFASLLAISRSTYVAEETEGWLTQPLQESNYIVGQYNSTFYYARNFTGSGTNETKGYEWLSSNDDMILQGAIDNSTSDGGSVFVKSGTYTASVTLKDNVTLIIEIGASTITVTINAGATAWLYDHENNLVKHWSSGTLVYHFEDSNIVTMGWLNMTQSQLVNMTYWQATSFPASPIEGQPFWRTDLNEMYVYDGTQWIISAPAGTTSGSQVEETSYIVFQDGSLTKMKNGTTGAIDASSSNATIISNMAIGNLTSGREWQEKVVWKGNFSITGIIDIPDYIYLDMYQAQFVLDRDIDCIFRSENYDTSNSQFVTFAGGRFIGMKSGGASSGSRTQGSCVIGCFHRCKFQDMIIYEFADYGIYCTATTTSNCNVIKFLNVQVGGTTWGEGCEDGGISVDNNGAYGVNDCKFEDCIFINNGAFQLKFDLACSTHQIDHCHFTGGSDTGSDAVGIWLANNNDKIMITDCHFEASDKEAILMDGFGDMFNNMIVNCNFWQCSKVANNTANSVIVIDDTSCAMTDMVVMGCTFASADANKPNDCITFHADNSVCIGNAANPNAYWDALVDASGSGNEVDHNT